MIKIDRADFDKLREAGLIKFKSNTTSPNFCICNKEHTGRSKTYYVTEEYKILKFLGKIPNKKNK